MPSCRGALAWRLCHHAAVSSAGSEASTLQKPAHSKPKSAAPASSAGGASTYHRLNDYAPLPRPPPAGTVTHLAPELLQAGTKITAAVDTYAFGICLYEIYAGKRCYAGERLLLFAGCRAPKRRAWLLLWVSVPGGAAAMRRSRALDACRAKGTAGCRSLAHVPLSRGSIPLSGLQRETIIQRVLRHALRPVFPPAAPTAYVQLAEACWSTAPSDRPTMSEVVARLRQIADALARYEGDGGGAGGRSLVAEAAAAVIEAAKWSVAGAAAAELEE